MSAPRRLGRYELLAPLGRGGMGAVYEAVLVGPLGFRKPVALKVLRPGAGQDSDRDALVREARLGALLSHPNVVGTLELGQVDGQWFVAMELVRGPSTQELAREAALPGRVVLEIGIQACAGLAHIHGLRADGLPVGLVHRDIKPGNLLVDRSGLVKVADLGIARLLGGPHEIAGTLGYMAPEQITGQEDARADLFSLGVTLYRLATGHRPFGHGRDAIIATAAVEARLADPDFLAPVDAAVPGLGPVLGRCLRAGPDDRWRSAGDLGEALRGLRQAVPDGPSLLDLLVAVRSDAHPDQAVRPSQVRVEEPSSHTVVVPHAAGHLPRHHDGFVGRRDELEALVRTVETGEAVVTLHGPGGAGKTRLAVEVALRVGDLLPGGASFCDLADATTLDGLCGAVAGVLDVPLEQDDPVRRIGRALAARGRCLVVLDNLEGVMGPAATAVGAWREGAPHATLLCTSRRALAIPGEVVQEVGPLLQRDAVGLAEARAPRALTREELRALPALVDRLDRLPLAIELAVARLRLLSLAQLDALLEDRFRLLAGGGPERPDRHRSLWVSLEGSWSLLRGWEQGAMVQLSVFADGVSLQAAEAVLDLARWPLAPHTLDVMSDLVDHALLRFDADTGRFSMLQVVAAFAAEQADDRARHAAESRHWAWFAQLGAPEALHEVRRRGDVDALARVSAELENLVIATRRAARAGAAEAAGACALATWAVMGQRGPLGTGLLLLREARGEGDHARAVELELGITRALVLVGRADEAAEVVARALEAARAGPDRVLEVEALVHAATTALRRGVAAEVAAWTTEAQQLARRIGHPLGEARAMGTLGAFHQARGRYVEAARLEEGALALIGGVGDPELEARLLANLAVARRGLGEREASLEASDRSIALLRRRRSWRSLGVALSNRSLDASDVGRLRKAHEMLQEANALGRRTGDLGVVAMSTSNLASLLLTLGDLPGCARQIEVCRRVCLECGDPSTLAVITGHQGRLHLVRGELDEAEAAMIEAVARGRALGSERRVVVGEASLGEVHLAQGRLDEARLLVEPGLAYATERDMTPMVGVFAGLCAILDAHQGRAPDTSALDGAIERLRAEHLQLYLVESLACRGVARQIAGQAGASTDLEAARDLAEQAGFGAQGPVGVLLATAGWPLR